MRDVVIIGGGVIGLSCAYYLKQEGCSVTVVDASSMEDGASYGNAGHVVPSHFVPLASPGIVAQGLRWMLKPSSPFYIKPRLNADLIRWGLTFWRQSGEQTMRRNMRPLQQLLALSRDLLDDMAAELGNTFFLQERGILILYKTAATEHHEAALVRDAAAMGMEAAILSAAAVQDLETATAVDARGGVLYHADAHMHPGLFMRRLRSFLEDKGVTMIPGTEITGFETKDRIVNKVLAGKESFKADHVVLANGAWMQRLAHLLGIRIPMQGGKGYSLTYPDFQPLLRYPAILADHRVVTTPVGPHLRLAGTMEINGLSSPVMPRRVAAIVDSVQLYYPELQLPPLTDQKVWSGIRPLSPDGLPYIGNPAGWANLTIAGGHAMLGLSLATGTGKLVQEIITGQKSSMETNAFGVNRFG